MPYAVTKLLRLLRYMELPGKGWAGWHFSRGALVTPEGRSIEGHESSWWSLMVLRARSFGKLYDLQRGVAQPAKPAYSESCTPFLASLSQPARQAAPLGNTGGTNSVSISRWLHSDTITPQWPLLSDSHPKSKPSQSPTANGSESPLIRWSGSPLTRIYNGPKLPLPVPRLRYSVNLNPLPQSLPQALQALRPLPQALPQLHGISLSSQPSPSSVQSPSQSLAPSRAKPIGRGLRTGTGATLPIKRKGAAL